jgi:hypothetical protein
MYEGVTEGVITDAYFLLVKFGTALIHTAAVGASSWCFPARWECNINLQKQIASPNDIKSAHQFPEDLSTYILLP